MCMQCVAQSTPMVAVGLTVLRRDTFMAWLKATVLRRRAAPVDAHPSAPQR